MFQMIDWSSLPEYPALVDFRHSVTWRQLSQEIGQRQARHQALANQRIGLPLSPTMESLSDLLALSSLGCHLYLLASDTQPDALAEYADRFQWSGWLNDDEFIRRPGESSRAPFLQVANANKSTSTMVTILTSGTTGKPKAVEHTWASLSRPVRRQATRQTWLLTFRPHLYAGLQVILQSLLSRGTLVLGSSLDASAIAHLATTAEVDCASATPSYWRWLLTNANPQDLKSIPLKQITLGGETVDQGVLDGLAQNFSAARLVHIYATTELGRCFSVTDGKAGFPISFLDQVSTDGVELRIEQGELWVRSANAMHRYEQHDDAVNVQPRSEWFATGDLVQTDGDRVYFAGRQSEMINVGGNKVHPIEVERAIRQVPGVAEVRVFGKPSSLVGQLVACQIVVAKGEVPDTVLQAVRSHVLTSLTAFQRPRLIEIVDQIPLTSAGKVARSTEAPND